MSTRLLLAACASAIAGCASQAAFTSRSADEVRSGACEQRSPEVFVIRGEIDAELAACVRHTFDDTTRTLALNTEGGSVEHALDIAEVLQNRRLVMRVEGECNSSCANYFLPLAARIEFSPEAIILLHGSVDPWTIDRWRNRRAEFMAMEAAQGRDAAKAEESFQSLLTLAERLVERQADFARRHRVASGWLMVRRPGSGEIPGLAPQPGKGQAILVEEAMMRSCLPHVEIQPYQAQVDRRWTRSYRRLGLIWKQIAPSGRTVCIDTSEPVEP